MAKLKEDAITEADMQEYLQERSDFAFELRVLKQLCDAGFECKHGGSYTDPKTSKTRQFDIRATIQTPGSLRLRLAVECKHLREHFPLLVHCVPRQEHESRHDFICSLGTANSVTITDRRMSVSLTMSSNESRYALGEPVGKSCEQVGKRQDNGKFTNTDSDVYDKWSQALASAHDLVEASCREAAEIGEACVVSLVLPVVVVPNETLWAVEYNEKGDTTESPRQVNQTAYYVCYDGITQHIAGWGKVPYELTHLEFVTVAGLDKLIADFRVKGNNIGIGWKALPNNFQDAMDRLNTPRTAK